MKNITRRKILGMTAASVAAIPLVMIGGRAHADGHAKLDPNDPQAKALQYTHESTVEGKNCANCQLYLGGDAAWGGCPIFAGKEVAAAGYCTAWAPKA